MTSNVEELNQLEQLAPPSIDLTVNKNTEDESHPVNSGGEESNTVSLAQPLEAMLHESAGAAPADSTDTPLTSGQSTPIVPSGTRTPTVGNLQESEVLNTKEFPTLNIATECVFFRITSWRNDADHLLLVLYLIFRQCLKMLSRTLVLLLLNLSLRQLVSASSLLHPRDFSQERGSPIIITRLLIMAVLPWKLHKENSRHHLPLLTPSLQVL